MNIEQAMNTTEKAAKILVSSGYADESNTDEREFEGKIYYVGWRNNNADPEWHDPIDWVRVEPFSDTLEGRRQLDVIEDWLVFNRGDLWTNAFVTLKHPTKGDSHHQWRLDRVKWCLEQLPEKDCE